VRTLEAWLRSWPTGSVQLRRPGNRPIPSPTPADLLHLSGLHPRRLLKALCGLAAFRTIDTQRTLAALNHTIVVRRPERGLIHHSDRGVQYASSADIERLTEIGAQISMSAKGNPYDNAKAERCFKPLKREAV
jgi:hypothetical protein